MIWAFINTVSMELTYWLWENQDTAPVNVETSIMADPGTIMNIISYDGTSPYELPEGMQLIQVPDTANIGDTGYLPT